MTNDEFNRLARKAGLYDVFKDATRWQSADGPSVSREDLRKVAELVAELVAEQCARECDATADRPESSHASTAWAGGAAECAAAIRAKFKEPT